MACRRQKMPLESISKDTMVPSHSKDWTLISAQCSWGSNKRMDKSTKNYSFWSFSDGRIIAFKRSNMLRTERGYICKPCNKSINANINRHVWDVHLNQYLYQCPFCHGMSPTRNAFGNHLRRHHSSEQFKGLDFKQCEVFSPFSEQQ